MVSITRSLTLPVGLVLLCLSLSGCLPFEENRPAFRPAKLTHAIRTELYFGELPEKDWKKFLAEEVTPRFPDGLTWLPVQGQWREKDGSISQEKSRLLILVHADAAADEEKIEQIRQKFVRKYGHESVLRASQPARVAF